MLALALALGAGGSVVGQTGSSDKRTIVTTGMFEKGMLMGKTIVTVNFTSAPGKRAKYEVSGPMRYVTEGVVVSKGDSLEFLSLAEAKARFKDMGSIPALCTLDFDGSSHSCRSDEECKGKCVLHKSPEYCVCQ